MSNKQISVTVSIGVSTFSKGDDATSVFERADKALYLSKDSGRNIVQSESDL